MKTMDPFIQTVLEAYENLRNEGVINMAVDSLPYTQQFEELYIDVQREYPKATKNEVYRKLVNARKQARCRNTHKTLEEMNALAISQIRILKALNASPGGLTRQQIAKKADVSLSMTGMLGPAYKADIADCEKRYGRRSLMGFGYVRAEEEQTLDGEVFTYHITTAGKNRLAELASTK